MKIKELISKKNGKYKVLMDDSTELELYEDVIVNLNLFSENRELNEILKVNEKEELKYKTIKYIEKKMRSKKEIVLYLNKICDDLNIKNEIISYLEKINLIDDLKFAKAYTNDKFFISKWGREKIKQGLIENDIHNFDILEIINEKEEKERIENIVNNYQKKNVNYSFFKLKEKLYSLLKNKGYRKVDIEEILSSLEFDDSENLRKEFEKLKKKLNVKTLDNKIINKLMAKGYKYEDIKKLER